MGYFWRRSIAWLLAVGAGAAGAGTGRSAGADLDVGSPAPALDVEHWFESAAGDSPIEGFEPGRVYVVEFWATWCRPCRASMPHLAAVQERLAARGVTIIGVSDEGIERIEKFLEKKTGDTTFGALTRKYRLAADPDGSVNREYMEAAGLRGIPQAFIVGKQGLIEWFGHPLAMDGPLGKVVDGTWDRAEYAAFRREQAVFEPRLAEISDMLDEGRTDAVIDAIDGLLVDVKTAGVKARFEVMRAQAAVQAGGPDAVEAFATGVRAAGDSAERLNELAWAVVTLGEQRGDLPPELVAAALGAAEKAVGLEPESALVLDTLAHLQDLRGDLAAALATQRRAAAQAGRNDTAITGYLEELEKRAAERR